jgi:hypothetical protein
MRDMLKSLMLLENTKIEFSMKQVPSRADALQILAASP